MPWKNYLPAKQRQPAQSRRKKRRLRESQSSSLSISKPNERIEYMYVVTLRPFRLLTLETSAPTERAKIDTTGRRVFLRLRMTSTEGEHHAEYAPATAEPLAWSTRILPRSCAVSLPPGCSMPSKRGSGPSGFHHRAERLNLEGNGARARGNATLHGPTYRQDAIERTPIRRPRLPESARPRGSDDP